MKVCRNNRISVWLLCTGLYLVASGAMAADADATATVDSSAPQQTDRSGTQKQKPPAAAQQEDVIDRVLSPLDNAVTDINQELNEKDDSGTNDFDN